MSELHFLNPLALWLLAAVPPFAAVLVWLSWRRKRQLLLWFGQEVLWSRYSQPLTAGRYQWKGLCVVLTCAAGIIALARPSIEHGRVEFPRGTIDVIAMVDESRSMAVPDYKGQVRGYYYGGGTRLDMAKKLLLDDVVASLHGNRLGVITFAGKALPHAFITDDMPALNWILRRAITIGGAPGEGSSLAKAFDLSFKMFDLDSDPAHRKLIVLFSDGGNDDDSAYLNAMLAECQKRGIEVIVAGLGKNANAAIPVKELPPIDQQAFRDKQWYEENGEVVTNTAIDENTLRLIANKTGGRYVRVNSVSDFHIGSLVSRTEVTYIKGEEELFVYPLMVAAIFLILSAVAPLEPVPVVSAKNPNEAKLRRRK